MQQPRDIAKYHGALQLREHQVMLAGDYHYLKGEPYNDILAKWTQSFLFSQFVYPIGLHWTL